MLDFDAYKRQVNEGIYGLRFLMNDLSRQVGEIVDEIPVDPLATRGMFDMFDTSSYNFIEGRSKIGSLIIDSPNQVYNVIKIVRDKTIDTVLDDIQMEYLGGRMLSQNFRGIIKAAVRQDVDDVFKGMSIWNRLEYSMAKGIRPIYSALDTMKAVDADKVINARISKNVSFGYGASLFKQYQRLLMSETHRTKQRVELFTLVKLGFEKFKTKLSPWHYDLMKWYKNYIPGREICEVYARRRATGYRQVYRMLPAHPHCGCTVVGTG